jgi:tetratricopeptide (TPR) repeat protein
MRDRLPSDEQVEVLRLWGLSAIKLGDQKVFTKVITQLGRYRTQSAARVQKLLQGFPYRIRGDLDHAEEKFLEAWKLAPRNQSINRELASLYCKQRRYSDAESHARAAYETAPTNPFIIDIMAETLLDKVQAGLPVDAKELRSILGDLAVYGDAPGSSFFLIRDAQQKAGNRDYSGAMQALNRAVERTPALSSPYFIRAEVLMRMVDISGAERDLHEINRLLTDAGGFSEGDGARASELEIEILIGNRQFKVAKEKIERAAFLPSRVAQRLSEQLAKSIGFEPMATDSAMREWAKELERSESAARRQGKTASTVIKSRRPIASTCEGPQAARVWRGGLSAAMRPRRSSLPPGRAR